MTRKFVLSAAAVAALGLVSAHNVLASGINVTPSQDATALVKALIGNNSDVTLVPGSATIVSNTVGSDATSASTGAFDSATFLPFKSGVVLSSGKATGVAGPNTTDSNTTDYSAPGDSDLDKIVTPSTTNDASVLQFQFTTTKSQISFQYVFGSEEYNEFVNSEFNDVFAFFLNGKNIALIPGIG